MSSRRCHLTAFLIFVSTALTARWARGAERTDAPTTRPADAIVVFDGKDMAAWKAFDERKKLGFHLVDGALDLDKNNAVTRESFGDFRLHVEFRCPEEPPEITGQKHGNSGVYLHDRYEIQILGHRGNALPTDTEVGAIYHIKRPDKVAVRPDGTWQSFDIVFRAPRFDAAGKKTRDARLTMHHNGVLIHNDAPIPKVTGAARGEEAPTGPIRLQDKNHPVLFRNIWVVPLKEE
jgi:hypothetical protein